mgnify:CR=1 FL=1
MGKVAGQKYGQERRVARSRKGINREWILKKRGAIERACLESGDNRHNSRLTQR